MNSLSKTMKTAALVAGVYGKSSGRPPIKSREIETLYINRSGCGSTHPGCTGKRRRRRERGRRTAEYNDLLEKGMRMDERHQAELAEIKGKLPKTADGVTVDLDPGPGGKISCASINSEQVCTCAVCGAKRTGRMKGPTK